MNTNRCLTKSRFKLAVECPTKLYYSGKDEYADQSLADPFLKGLAEGGFQVGELARAYHPGGHDLQGLEGAAAVEKTTELLQREKVIIFEAAVRYENLFIRIDVLCKEGKVLDLIEVKARAYEGKTGLIGKRSGKISPAWKPYMMDVAFQEHVLKKGYPDLVIRPRMMLVDKQARTTVEGLNQKFRIVENGIQVNGDISPEALGRSVLKKVNVHQPLKLIREDNYRIGHKAYDFEGYIAALAKAYALDARITPKIDCGCCGKCTFRASAAEEAEGKKSGYKECWKEAMGFDDADFAEPSVMDLGGFTRKQACLKSGKFFLRDLDALDFDVSKPLQKRQWLQVEKTVHKDPNPWIDREGLARSFSGWTYPLHFIDFETTAVAIPFNKGRHPYEMIAFQFSHHMVHEDGRVEHADEYLNTDVGGFPNFEFIRKLKGALEQDGGTIFRYAAHENTVLNQIADQLADAEDIPDRDELIDWIKSITHRSDDGSAGSRDMVDMLDLVKNCYYQRDMGGSNSIKKVLPAVLNSSDYLQEKYSQPIYSSSNFENHVWVQRDESGRVTDPYKLLPPVFKDEHLADGSSAMNAYARLQFSDLPAEQRTALRQALLRYCELDTLAMVMICEAWQDLVSA